jgi:hypothetical protein
MKLTPIRDFLFDKLFPFNHLSKMLFYTKVLGLSGPEVKHARADI